MLDHLSKSNPSAAPASAVPDLLTELLIGLRLDGVEYGRCLLQPPWAVAFPKHAEARFHLVSSGGCWLRTQTSDWIQLNRGDAVLLPRGDFHVLASAREMPAIDIGSLARVTASENIYLLQSTEGNGAPHSDVMFCGVMQFNLDPLHPLLTMMPEVMRAGDLATRDPTVPALMEAMEREIALDRPGAYGILARMADLLAASIIRSWVECGCSHSTGWVAAMRCPKLGKVLAAIHANPGADWTVPNLAELMGTSRSSFAEAFARTVGGSPAKYVAKLRMVQARRWIAQEGMRISIAAERLGYDSEASFSRAFKRVMGHNPSASRTSAPPQIASAARG